MSQKRHKSEEIVAAEAVRSIGVLQLPTVDGTRSMAGLKRTW